MCQHIWENRTHLMAHPFFFALSLEKNIFEFFRSVRLVLWPGGLGRGRGILGVVGGVGIGVAERIEGRDRVRLKGNGETESFKRTELATNRQKNKITTTTDLSYLFPKKNIISNIFGWKKV